MSYTSPVLTPVEFQDWAKGKKEHAQQLCGRALAFAEELFQSGDLRPYLEILSRLHTYNFYNLLLLLQQYPDACCLATFREWKKQAPHSGFQILKSEHKGKGIELITPFTEPPRSKNRALFWVEIKQFDVSQTNFWHPYPKIVYETEPHLESAICSVLFHEYQKTVIYRTSDPAFSELGVPGFRTEDDIYCNAELSAEDRIVWLTQVLIELSEPEQLVTPAYGTLFASLALSCLLSIWNLPDSHYLYQDQDLIRSIPKNMHALFLDQLQILVRRYAELVHCAYLEQTISREEDA